MEFALIRGGVVVNVIVVDNEEAMVEIEKNWDHVVRIDTIEGSEVGIGWKWEENKFVKPIVVSPTPEWEWYIDHGPFTDRLGTAATFAIDTSTDPAFVAIRADFARRKWIDLKDSRVAAMVSYLAGQPLPSLGTLAPPLLTAEQAAEALTTPVAPTENLALRKLYFS